MPRLISHRGNLYGPSSQENHPDYIQKALDLGYYVEVDVRIIGSRFYLGHDEPQYEVDISFLQNEFIYVHCKTIETLNALLPLDVHVFFHQNDDCTLTSKGDIWTYPGINVFTERSIIVDLQNNQLTNEQKAIVKGICTDHVYAK